MVTELVHGGVFHVEYLRAHGKPFATVVALQGKEEDQVGVGLALCSPKDNFNKITGTTIAIGRAQHLMLGSETYWAAIVSKDKLMGVLKLAREKLLDNFHANAPGALYIWLCNMLEAPCRDYNSNF